MRAWDEKLKGIKLNPYMKNRCQRIDDLIERGFSVDDLFDEIADLIKLNQEFINMLNKKDA